MNVDIITKILSKEKKSFFILSLLEIFLFIFVVILDKQTVSKEYYCKYVQLQLD